MVTVNISQNQAKEFARAIFADISAYVEAHREEYEEFLQTERAGNGEEDKN